MFSESLPDDKFEEIMVDCLKLPRPAAAQILWSVMSGDFRDILSTITVPTLCIGGIQSNLPLECVSWLGSQIPGAEVTLIPGGHFIFMEEPESFNLAVSDFLESIATAKPMLDNKSSHPAQDQLFSAEFHYSMDNSLVPDDALKSATAW
jgi:hypothetical protein